MRFLVDMSVSPKVREALAARGHDVVHCTDIGLARAADDAIFARAIARGEVVVTSDHDFPRLALVSQRSFPGIVLLELDNPDAATSATRLGEALYGLGTTEIANAIVVVEPARVRMHRVLFDA